ncbi:MAG: DNA-binding response regulator, LuxR family [Pseudonocardiales bacterium]|jgi:DNA-binding NarL/FixJ family response regulator|nr:DNA-binding response regulator, LuxR family [Pseudonocardiales bacterium]
MIRVGVVDDQDLLRTGFRMLLDTQADLRVVGDAADGRAAIDMVARAIPDVVLMDVRMPVLDGVAATRAITAAHPTVRVLILTTFDLDEYVVEGLRAGASGFLLKDVPAPELLTAIRAVAAGDAVVAPAATRRLLDRFLLPGSSSLVPDARIETLTPRELEVFGLMGRGRTNTEIAQALFLSETTVKTHVTRVLAKLTLRDRVQAVVRAYETGLILPGTAQ